MKKSICIIGLGYIGLPTATMFSLYGHKVLGVDVNNLVVENLNKGHIIIEEPNLENLVKYVVNQGNLKVSLNPSQADVFIISVPTPIKDNKKADLTYVISAAKSIVPYIRKGNIVVLESTSPVGTTEEIVKSIVEESGLKAGSDIFLGYSPERVIPGNIIYELKNNDRVIGGINQESANKIKEVYKTIVDGNIYLTDCKTAEMCKLMENTYRDVNIALANELAIICESIGINAWEVIKYSNKHPRVNLMNPGPGVGGHCLAVDPWFIVQQYPDLANLIHYSRIINDSMPIHVYEKIIELLEDNENKKVTILGMTYKADIDDIRESPIIKLINLLKKDNIKIDVYDPYVKDYYLGKDDIIEACKDSDLVVLGVNHNQFRDLPLDKISKVMRGNIILDTRNFLDKNKVEQNGLTYKLLGKM